MAHRLRFVYHVHVTKEDAAYIAGFFDGEGSVNVYWRKGSKNGVRYARLMARISQTERGILEWVRDAAGVGTVHANARRPDKPHWKTQHNYIVASEAARLFLAEIRPYLRVKAEVVDRALELDRIHCKRRAG